MVSILTLLYTANLSFPDSHLYRFSRALYAFSMIKFLGAGFEVYKFNQMTYRRLVE